MPSCSDEATYVAKENVKDVMKKGIKRKRGNYCHYDDETRAEIGKYANLHGNTSADKCRSRPVCALINASLIKCPKVLFRTTQLKHDLLLTPIVNKSQLDKLSYFLNNNPL